MARTTLGTDRAFRHSESHGGYESDDELKIDGDIDVGLDEVLTLSLPDRRKLEVLLQSEEEFSPSSDYIERTQYPHNKMSITWRKDVVNWIVEHMCTLNYGQGTVALAVRLLDRFLSRVKVDSAMLSVTALTCCVIATKLVGVRPISMGYIHAEYGNTIDVAQVKLVEVEVCKALEFKLNPRGPQAFVTNTSPLIPEAIRNSVASKASDFLTLSMLEYTSLRFPASISAAAALALAHDMERVSSTPFRTALATVGINTWTREYEACVDFLRKAVLEVHYADETPTDAMAAVDQLDTASTSGLDDEEPML